MDVFWFLVSFAVFAEKQLFFDIHEKSRYGCVSVSACFPSLLLAAQAKSNALSVTCKLSLLSRKS